MSCHVRHVAVPSSTTLATMRCQSPLSSEALMSLLCPSMNHTGCPGTSVSDVPLLSSRLSFPSPPNSPDSVFLIHVPGKQAAVDVYVSVVYDVPLPLEILLHCFSSLSMISLASSAGTRLPLPNDMYHAIVPWDLTLCTTAREGQGTAAC